MCLIKKKRHFLANKEGRRCIFCYCSCCCNFLPLPTFCVSVPLFNIPSLKDSLPVSAAPSPTSLALAHYFPVILTSLNSYNLPRRQEAIEGYYFYVIVHKL